MSSDPTLDKLLKRLEKAEDDQVARTTLQGRALSRSDKNLHLAVAAGIVAVPLASIERVISVPSTRPDIVRVVVRDPNAIRTLFHAPRYAHLAEGEHGEPIGPAPPVGVGTCIYVDTPTITGDIPDACDDEDTECRADDLDE